MDAVATLGESLHYLKLEDLKLLVKNFHLQKVRLAQPKDKLIQDICSSPTLETNDEVKKQLEKISEYFLNGGKQTLTLYTACSVMPTSDVTALKRIFLGAPSVNVGPSSFRFKSFRTISFQGRTFFVAGYEYPGRDREVFDFNKGPISYTPIATAECVIRPREKDVVLDIRSSSAKADDFSQAISQVIWGKNSKNILNVIPSQVLLSHDLAMKLRTKFNARSFQIKISEADEIDDSGKLHPSSTDYLSKGHDLTVRREALGILPSAEDQAHGLEFHDEFESIRIDNGCKILLSYPTSQVSFKRTTSFGAYNKLIDTILELQQ